MKKIIFILILLIFTKSVFANERFIPLELFPESNHHIVYSNDKEPLIHVRPNQFQLFSQKKSKGNYKNGIS